MPVVIEEADVVLSQLLDRVRRGEEVVIARRGEPVARVLRARGRKSPRVPGSAVGSLEIHPSFDDPLPPEFRDAFGQ